MKTWMKVAIVANVMSTSAFAGVCTGPLKGDEASLTAFQQAAQKDDKAKLKSMLLSDCVDVKKAIQSTNTPAFFFATDDVTLSWYEKRGVDLTTKSKDGLTSVMFALAQRTPQNQTSKTMKGRVDLAIKTIGKPTVPVSFLTEKDGLGRTAIHFALMTGRSGAVTPLLNKAPALIKEGAAQSQHPWFYVFQNTCLKQPVSFPTLVGLQKVSEATDLTKAYPSPIASWLKISVTEFAVLRANESKDAAEVVKSIVGNTAWTAAEAEVSRMKKERPDLAKKLRYFEYTSIPKICDAAVEE
jgi:hypothetical protein